jgi:hypothetical protein
MDNNSKKKRKNEMIDYEKLDHILGLVTIADIQKVKEYNLDFVRIILKIFKNKSVLMIEPTEYTDDMGTLLTTDDFMLLVKNYLKGVIQ